MPTRPRWAGSRSPFSLPYHSTEGAWAYGVRGHSGAAGHGISPRTRFVVVRKVAGDLAAPPAGGSRYCGPRSSCCVPLEVRRPGLRRAGPHLHRRLEPRCVVQRAGLDERHLRHRRGEAEDRRAARRAEAALACRSPWSSPVVVNEASVSPSTSNAARGTATITENGLPVWRWQSVQWQTAWTSGSASML